MFLYRKRFITYVCLVGNEMSLNHYVKMHTAGTTYPTAPMNVYLYPYADNQYIKSAIQSSGNVTNAIKDAADQLLNYGAIDYYAIYRWDWGHSDTKYPYWGDMDNCGMTDIQRNFKSFLQNAGDPGDTCGYVGLNGTGDNNYNHVGVHQLIHSGYTGCNETYGYAPAGAGAEKIGDTAFKEGRVAWSPVCSDDHLSEGAAIQETTHCFINPTEDETTSCHSGDDYPREHSLGTIHYYSSIDWAECTPMLTYHWDDFDTKYEDPYCPCPVDRETTPDTHIRSLTSCTKQSVKNTAGSI